MSTAEKTPSADEILWNCLLDTLETQERCTAMLPVGYNAYFRYKTLHEGQVDMEFRKIPGPHGGGNSSGSRLGIVYMSPKIVFED